MFVDPGAINTIKNMKFSIFHEMQADLARSRKGRRRGWQVRVDVHVLRLPADVQCLRLLGEYSSGHRLGLGADTGTGAEKRKACAESGTGSRTGTDYDSVLELEVKLALRLGLRLRERMRVR